MKVDIGNAIIKVGVNVSSLGAGGFFLLDDKVTAVNGIIATIVGFLVVALGVTLRDWRAK